MTGERDGGATTPPSPHPFGENVRRLVDACLEEAGSEAIKLVDTACATHSRIAAVLRERFRTLAAAGLLGPLSRTVLRQETASDESGEPRDRRDTIDQDTIGSYRLVRELGRGGQAVVYLAEDLRLRRRVAIKVLAGLGPLSPTALRRFRREAEVASRLDHPGICTVYEAGLDQGTPFIAMRLVEGVTLADSIRDAVSAAGTLPDPDRGSTAVTAGSSTRTEVDRLVHIIEKAARALHAAHEAGIVHRDVKPGNIMVTGELDPVLLDFGLAAGEDSGLVTLTQEGNAPGTLAYMSPEQLAHTSGNLDRRTDVYSLGITLYECLTLRRPFRAETREAMHEAIRFRSPENPRRFNPKVTRDLRAVIETALEKERDRRYRTALAFAEDLRRVRERKPIEARPPGPAGRAIRWARRRPVRATLVLALALGVPLVTGLGGYVVAKWPDIAAQRRRALRDRLEGHLARGFDELGRGSPERARRAFEAALDLDPGCVEAVAGRALALLGLHRVAECVAFLDPHGRRSASVPAIERIRADALRLLGPSPGVAGGPGPASGPVTDTGFFLEAARLVHGPRPDRDHLRRALHHLTRAVFTAPSPRQVYQILLARVAADIGDGPWARRAARALAANWPDSPLARHWAEYARRAVPPDGTQTSR